MIDAGKVQQGLMRKIDQRADSMMPALGERIADTVSYDMMLYNMNNGGTKLYPYVTKEMVNVVKNAEGKYSIEFDMGNHSDFFKECFQFYLDGGAGQKALKLLLEEMNGG